MSTTAQQLAQARQKLLDLTLRNRLLNYRPSKLRSVSVVGESPAQVFDALVLKEKPLTFRATGQRSDASGAVGTQTDEDLFAVEEWHAVDGGERPHHQTDKYLDTALDEEALEKKLFHVYHEGHTLIEEQGYSVVHLAVGFLEWYESDSSTDLRRAPRVLIPAELERVVAGNFSRVKWTGEDVYENISLAAKVAEQSVTLPTFAVPEDPAELEAWFAQVKAAIAHRPRWRVTTDIVLDFFSFTKFVMFKDLDSAAWPPEKKPEDHGLLRSLFEPAPLEATDDVGFDADDVDRRLTSRGAVHITDADPSQIAVIEDAKAGRNLVVEGPPGTGKSQTITNLIGETLAAGKTVLFVSEKMAALDVVKKRLDRAGLAPFCLELHSRKTNKKAVLEELKRSLQSVAPAAPSDAVYDEHEQLKSELNAYAADLRTPIGEGGRTAYEALAERQRGTAYFEHRKRAVPPLPQIPGAETVRPEDVAAAERVLRDVEYVLPLVSPIATHIWRDSTIKLFLPHDEARLQMVLESLREAFERMRLALSELEALAAVTPADCLGDVERVCRAATVMAAGSGALARELLLSEAWNAPNVAADELISRVEKVQRDGRECSVVFTEEAIGHESLEPRVAEFRALAAGFFRFFNGRYRALRRDLATLFRENAPGTTAMVAELNKLVALQQERRSLRQTQGAILFGAAWRADASDVASLRQLAGWLVSFRREVVSHALTARAVEVVATGVDAARVHQSAEAARTASRDLHDLLELLGRTLVSKRHPLGRPVLRKYCYRLSTRSFVRGSRTFLLSHVGLSSMPHEPRFGRQQQLLWKRSSSRTHSLRATSRHCSGWLLRTRS